MGLQPNLTPRAFAGSFLLARAVARQTTLDSARPPSTVSIRRSPGPFVARASGPDLHADDRDGHAARPPRALDARPVEHAHGGGRVLISGDFCIVGFG